MFSFDLKEIHSLSSFQRNTKEHISRMKKKRSPIVVTINGKAEMIALDVESFQNIIDLMDQLEAVEGIKRGLQSKQRNEGKTLAAFDKDMRKKFKLSAPTKK